MNWKDAFWTAFYLSRSDACADYGDSRDGHALRETGLEIHHDNDKLPRTSSFRVMLV